MRIKNADSASKKLGLDQETLASILDVNRSALAMYESELREMPLQVKLKLYALLDAVRSQDVDAQKQLNQMRAQNRRQLLETRWTENQIQQKTVELKLRPLMRSYQKLLKTYQLHLALETFSLEKPEDQDFLKRHAAKKAGKLTNTVLKNIATLELKHELLQLEQAHLKLLLEKQDAQEKD